MAAYGAAAVEQGMTPRQWTTFAAGGAALLVTGLLVLLILPAPDPAARCGTGFQAMTRYELMFGASRRQGPPVNDAEWTAFLAAEVTPRFPDGLTVLQGDGQWRNRDGVIIKEHTRVLVIISPLGPATAQAIEAIRLAYRQAFSQDSVLRSDTPACVSF
jgi:hypothetical protein